VSGAVSHTVAPGAEEWGREPGMGIRFTSLSPSSRHWIDVLVDRLSGYADNR
jgi:hypothetical protein